MEKGYVHIYTGNGKGKTTAAIGLAVRAAGAGMQVWFGQFCKGSVCSEHNALSRFGDTITVMQFGKKSGFIIGEPTSEDIQCAVRGLQASREALFSGKYSLVVLDEACAASHLNLISSEDLCALISQKPETVELVLTGRNASDAVIACADLVTEMKEIKHYYALGRTAQKGIEM